MSVRGPRLVFDFPSPSGAAERLVFSDPHAVLIAEQLDEVRQVVADAEAFAAAGRFVAGFVSYDAAPVFEPAMRIPGRARTPLAWFAVFDAPMTSPSVIPSDPAQNAIPSGSESVVPNDSQNVIPSEARDLPLPLGHDAPTWTPNAGRPEYNAAIEHIRTAIGDGDVYQVNHTLRLRAPWNGDPSTLYAQLREAQRPEFGAYLDLGPFQIVSASPELFFRRRGDTIEARPMKGTARRGRWLEEDQHQRATLVTSEKDRAENLMIVDLLRNDIGKVAVTGTVNTPKLLTVERYPNVWQLTSTIAATLRPTTSLLDIFTALFPSGSVTGAPKIAATHTIAELEHDARGVYCGAIGLITPGGDCTFNVAIRTVVVDAARGTAEYGVGGGITYDSTPSGEYDELLAKSAILTARPRDFALIETMRLTDGRYVRRSEHLTRLAQSAEYFGFADPVTGAEAALGALAATHAAGCHRVRLTVSADGTASATETPFDPSGVNSPTPLRCAIGSIAVDSGDPLLFHKTTHRAVFEQARAAYPDADDTLLVNQHGELTEFTIGNLVVELDGKRYTPPREGGLLAGVFRQSLLTQGIIAERVLHARDLQRATAIWRVNSLREWTPMKLSEASRPTER